MAKDKNVKRKNSIRENIKVSGGSFITEVEDDDDDYVEEEEYSEPPQKVTSIPQKTDMPVQRTTGTGKAPEPRSEAEKPQPAFYMNGAPAYKGYSANIYSDKKLYGPCLKSRVGIYTTDAQVDQIKIQSLMSKKKLDISAVYRTGADIVLEMDDDTYSRLVAAAKNEDVSVATIVNRVLKNAGY